MNYIEKLYNENGGVVNIYNQLTPPLTLDQAYTQWKSQTKVNLHSDLVLKSREQQVEHLLHLLSTQTSKIIVVSPRGKDE